MIRKIVKTSRFNSYFGKFTWISITLVVLLECSTFANGIVETLPETHGPQIEEFTYPTTWHSVRLATHPPFDLHPMFAKQMFRYEPAQESGGGLGWHSPESDN